MSDYKILRKTGRLVNGNEGGAGTIYHAVKHGIALCGAKPGRLSDWSFTEGKEVICPRCLKKLKRENEEFWDIDTQLLKLDRMESENKIKDKQIAELQAERQKLIEELEIKTNSFKTVQGERNQLQVKLKQLEDVEQRKSLALYSALYQVLEKEDAENVSSRIDQLTKQDNGEINDIFKENRVLQAKVKELEEEKEELNKDWQEELYEMQRRENKNLAEIKKLQHQLQAQPKQIVEEIKTNIEFIKTPESHLINCDVFTEVLDSLLKKYEEKGG